ncbi:MAG: DHHA2 domain-containing protein [Candidatus Moraniibacteriota bacterium]
MKPILVTSYVSPDLDGLASAVAYAEYLGKTGVEAVVGLLGEPSEESQYTLDRFGLDTPTTISDTDGFERIVLADASDLSGLEGKVEPGKVVTIIDHRAVNGAAEFPNADVQIELVGAAATLVTEKFFKVGLAISVRSAILIQAAIISNTLNFKAAVTTDRDREVSEKLGKIVPLPNDFWRDLFLAKSDLSGDKLAKKIHDDFASFELGGKKVGIAQIEMIGAEALARDRTGETVRVLDEIREYGAFDHVFQNTIELESPRNYLVASDDDTKRLLETALDVTFSGEVAERLAPLMRKQIVPLLKAVLEQRN